MTLGTITDEQGFLSLASPTDEGCWNWNGWLTLDGYGQCRAPRGSKQMAHRVAYEMFVGPIPVGLVIDHLCRNRSCVNPAHLEAVTQRENLARGINANAVKTHCKRGHEYSKGNTYTYPDGRRDCRTCRQAQAA